jgi:hypothetical protein
MQVRHDVLYLDHVVLWRVLFLDRVISADTGFLDRDVLLHTFLIVCAVLADLAVFEHMVYAQQAFVIIVDRIVTGRVVVECAQAFGSTNEPSTYTVAEEHAIHNYGISM